MLKTIKLQTLNRHRKIMWVILNLKLKVNHQEKINISFQKANKVIEAAIKHW
jgi:hypothetical protein